MLSRAREGDAKEGALQLLPGAALHPLAGKCKVHPRNTGRFLRNLDRASHSNTKTSHFQGLFQVQAEVSSQRSPRFYHVQSNNSPRKTRGKYCSCYREAAHTVPKEASHAGGRDRILILLEENNRKINSLVRAGPAPLSPAICAHQRPGPARLCHQQAPMEMRFLK